MFRHLLRFKFQDPCGCRNKGDCWEGLRFFDEKNLDENRRTLFRMCELRRQMKHNASVKPILSVSVCFTSLKKGIFGCINSITT